MRSGSRTEKTFIALWTFLVSAFCHTITDWQAVEMTLPLKDVEFFLASFAFGMLAIQFAQSIDRLPPIKGKCRPLFQYVIPRRMEGTHGCWGSSWMMPKWQCAKLNATIKDVEYFALLEALGL
jgi:hypothetical protein